MWFRCYADFVFNSDFFYNFWILHASDLFLFEAIFLFYHLLEHNLQDCCFIEMKNNKKINIKKQFSY